MSAPRTDRRAVALLALLAYIPALSSSPGRMPSDTKLYLYLDPGRLMSQAPYAWDTSQFGGWVPHQVISYLWPAGPFYWIFERLGAPDWVAHRLWLGSIFLLAGWGMLTLARALELPTSAAVVAALVYQCTPFIVPYVSRTSLMLMPWASLGWVTVAVLRLLRTGSWRWAAIAALIIGTVGGINATAVLMVVPAPVLLVVWELAHRRLDWSVAWRATVRLAALSVATSLWWMVMVVLQGRYGADVLAYSETLDVVSYSSTSTEALRSMGYWLAYVTDTGSAATTAALPYMSSVPLVIISFALPLLCLGGMIVTRWRYSGFAATLFVTGLVLAVGFHPYDDPAPLLAPLRDNGLALALRSSTRALPLVAMGLGLGAAACVAALHAHRPRRGWMATVAVSVLAVANLPALWLGRLVDPSLARDQSPPAAWIDAAAELDDPRYRVLQLPGAEFGAFRWGYTVDPPLAGLAGQPLITRDLLPLGSAGVMDLLYALDNRAQAGTLDPRAVAPVARLLGADHIWVTNDQAFERFRTPRPERFAALLLSVVDGLGEVRPFGDEVANLPAITMLDEEALADPLVGTPLAPVLLRSVDDPAPMVAIVLRPTVVDGSGDGVVDAAAAGWLTGTEPIVYAGHLTADELDRLAPGTLVVVTDSNRDRTLQWRGSQDMVGMTETGGPGSDGLPVDPQDQRLPVFDDETADDQTVAMFEGGLVTATDYGAPLALLPEYRAAMAVDGNPSTAWLVGRRFPPIGESISVSSVIGGTLRLVQPQDPMHRMMITEIDVTDAGGTVRHSLDERSLSPDGQIVDVGADGPVTISIAAIAERPDAPSTGTYFVGFAELGPVYPEFIRPPTTMLARAANLDRLAIVFRRDAVHLTDRWRADPEPVLLRRFDLPTTKRFGLVVTLRLDRRASDAAIDALGGVSGPVSNRRLAGMPDARAASAFDGDHDTAWISPFAAAKGSALTFEVAAPSSATTFSIVQPGTDHFSTITALTLRDASGEISLDVPLPGPDGRSALSLPRPLQGEVTVTVTGVEPRLTTDRRFGDRFELPVAITEIDGISPAIDAVAVPPCRDDLLTIDGVSIALRVDAAALLRGDAVDAVPCDETTFDLAAGTHRIVSTSGRSTGIDVDTVALATADARPTSGDATRVAATSFEQSSPTAMSAHVDACPDGCWVVLRQGYNHGWTASADGRSLGAPRQLDGGMNAWWITPSDTDSTITFRFAPQRVLWVALAVSGAAALLCVAIALWPRRRQAITPASAPPPALTTPFRPVSNRRARAAALLVVAASALLVSPAWALPGVVIAAAIVHHRRLRIGAASALAGMTLFAAVVAYRQVRLDLDANVTWLSYFVSLHRPMLFCAVVAAVLVACSEQESSVEPDASGSDGP